MKIGIVGAGAIAHGVVGLLQQEGHDVTLWSPSNRVLPPTVELEGAIDSTLNITVAKSAEELAQSSELIIFALPANGHKATMDAISPHLTVDHECIVSAHLSFGALYLKRLLAKRSLELTISAWDTTPLVCKPIETGRYNVLKIRNSIGVYHFPDDGQDYSLTKAGTVFTNQFVPMSNLLEITFGNLNPQVHMGMALCNMSRMEQGESWCQNKNVTPSVGRLIEALDRERLAVAQAFNVSTISIFDDHKAIGLAGNSVFEDHQTLHKQSKVWGPKTSETRYVLEDAPFGLCVITKLGELAGIATPVHSSGTELFSALYGRNFYEENDIIEHIDLNSLWSSASAKG